MQTFSFVEEPWHRRAIREGGSRLLKKRAWHRFVLADHALKRATELDDAQVGEALRAEVIAQARAQMRRDLIVYKSLCGTRVK